MGQRVGVPECGSEHAGDSNARLRLRLECCLVKCESLSSME